MRSKGESRAVQSLDGQAWFMQRMHNAGYKIDGRGECYGMSTASMCAFLAEDMSSFNQRLTMIQEIDEIDFNKNFTGYRFVLIDESIADKYDNNTLGDAESQPNGKIYVQINEDEGELIYLFYSEGHEYSGQISLEVIHGAESLTREDLYKNINQLDSYSKRIQEIILSQNGDVLNLGLRNKQRKLINKGKHEEASLLNDKIIEMTAFFDTVSLNQSPGSYSFLFEGDENLLVQKRERTLPITVPVHLDNHEKMPVLVHSYTGSYSPDELIAYLSMLESHLGSTSFSLQLSTKQHAINLNYDHENKQWLWIDPSHLPGKPIAETSLVVEELLAAYAGTEGLVLKTEIYTIHARQELIDQACLEMEDTRTWKKLHALTPEKINGTYDGDKRDQLYYHISEGNIEWIKNASNHSDVILDDAHFELLNHLEPNSLRYDAIVAVVDGLDLDRATKILFEACCSNNKNVVVMLLSSKKLAGYRDSLALNQNMDYGAIFQRLISEGHSPTNELMMSAFDRQRFDVVKICLESGLQPVPDMLLTTCIEGNVPILQAILNTGIPLDFNMEGIEPGDLNVIINTLLAADVIPPESVLIHAVNLGAYEAVDTLIQAGVHPSIEMVVTASSTRQMDIVKLLMMAREKQKHVQSQQDAPEMAAKREEQRTFKQQLMHIKKPVASDPTVEEETTNEVPRRPTSR